MGSIQDMHFLRHSGVHLGLHQDSLLPQNDTIKPIKQLNRYTVTMVF